MRRICRYSRDPSGGLTVEVLMFKARVRRDALRRAWPRPHGVHHMLGHGGRLSLIADDAAIRAGPSTAAREHAVTAEVGAKIIAGPMYASRYWPEGAAPPKSAARRRLLAAARACSRSTT